LMDALGVAIAGEGVEVRRLPSGAGHDAMAMAAISDIAMLFVRCKAGISHNPAESASVEDMGVAGRVLLRLLDDFAMPEP
ncbi:M20/M25/M40 family metallo-hydrolase, partial [Paraburkholderia sp. SIMBA_061]